MMKEIAAEYEVFALLYYFRGLRVLYFIAAIGTGVPLMLFILFFFGNRGLYAFGLLFGFLATLLHITIVAMVFQIIAQKKMDSIIKILTEQCDPLGFTETMKSMLLPNDRRNTYLLLQISTGRILAGRYDKAKAALDRVTFFSRRAGGTMQRVVYHNNYASYFINTGDFACAAAALQHMGETIQEKSLGRLYYDAAFSQYILAKSLYRMAQGDFEGCRQIFEAEFERAKEMYRKVAAQYALAKVHLHDGRAAEAKAALEYVATNGNKLYSAQKAREMLAGMGVPVPPPTTIETEV